MRLRIFPKEYDGCIAAGTPTEVYGKKMIEHDPKLAFAWTEADTARHKEMEDQSEVVEVEAPPKDRAYMYIEV